MTIRFECVCFPLLAWSIANEVCAHSFLLIDIDEQSENEKGKWRFTLAKFYGLVKCSLVSQYINVEQNTARLYLKLCRT